MVNGWSKSKCFFLLETRSNKIPKTSINLGSTILDHLFSILIISLASSQFEYTYVCQDSPDFQASGKGQYVQLKIRFVLKMIN